MATGFNLTSMAAWMKKRYTRDFVQTMVYPTSPFISMIKKNEAMGGDDFRVPVTYEDPMSVSALFATAQTNSTSMSSQAEVFAITRVQKYGVVNLDNQFILASQNMPEDAFFSGIAQKIDPIMRATTRRLGTEIYRGAWGDIGRVSAPGASTTLTLTRKPDVYNFSKGMRLQLAASQSADALRSAGAVGTVNGVDRNAGTLTMAANVLTTWSDAADTDFIFAESDRQDSATPTRRCISGFSDWIPQSAPTSTTFFGVNRTKDSRLGGVRYDGTAQNVDEALVDAASLLATHGAAQNQDYYIFMHPQQVAELTKILGAKVRYIDVKAGERGQVGFRGIELDTALGVMKVIADGNCPIDLGAVTAMDNWWLGSLGPAPRILNIDGLEALRVYNDDALEVRVGFYGNSYTNAPGWSCNVKLTVPSA